MAPVSTFPLPSPSPSCVVTALTTPPSRHSPPSCASPRGLARPHDARARTALLRVLPCRAPRSLAEPAALPPSPRPCSACSRRPAPRRRASHPPPAPLSGVWLRPPRPRPPGLACDPAPAPLRPAGPAPLSLADSLRLPRPAAVASRCAAPPSAPPTPAPRRPSPRACSLVPRPYSARRSGRTPSRAPQRPTRLVSAQRPIGPLGQ
nr:vegetative cell wall protein gp1-like [Aegilops tauschii subsp. strangulata]